MSAVLLGRHKSPASRADHRMITGGRWQLHALVVLAVAFAGRVAAQVTQYLANVTFLPNFDHWQSGALPYGVLLGSHMAILTIMAVVIRRASAGQLRLSEQIRRILQALGLLYFAFMVFRLIAGLTFLDGDGWFDALLPSMFHLVLASFVLVTSLGSSPNNAVDRRAELTS